MNGSNRLFLAVSAMLVLSLICNIAGVATESAFYHVYGSLYLFSGGLVTFVLFMNSEWSKKTKMGLSLLPIASMVVALGLFVKSFIS